MVITCHDQFDAITCLERQVVLILHVFSWRTNTHMQEDTRSSPRAHAVLLVQKVEAVRERPPVLLPVLASAWTLASLPESAWVQEAVQQFA